MADPALPLDGFRVVAFEIAAAGPFWKGGGTGVGVGVSLEIELSTPQAVSPKRARRPQATGTHRRLDRNFRCILLLGVPFIGVPAMSGGRRTGRASSLGASILGW